MSFGANNNDQQLVLSQAVQPQSMSPNQSYYHYHHRHPTEPVKWTPSAQSYYDYLCTSSSNPNNNDNSQASDLGPHSNFHRDRYYNYNYNYSHNNHNYCGSYPTAQHYGQDYLHNQYLTNVYPSSYQTSIQNYDSDGSYSTNKYGVQYGTALSDAENPEQLPATSYRLLSIEAAPPAQQSDPKKVDKSTSERDSSSGLISSSVDSPADYTAGASGTVKFAAEGVSTVASSSTGSLADRKRNQPATSSSTLATPPAPATPSGGLRTVEAEPAQPPRQPHVSSRRDQLGARRKNATRESTSILKRWLDEHLENPYPSKGEKIMLKMMTQMNLTQISTWFANARRRMKKERRLDLSSSLLPMSLCTQDQHNHHNHSLVPFTTPTGSSGAGSSTGSVGRWATMQTGRVPVRPQPNQYTASLARAAAAAAAAASSSSSTSGAHRGPLFRGCYSAKSSTFNVQNNEDHLITSSSSSSSSQASTPESRRQLGQLLSIDKLDNLDDDSSDGPELSEDTNTNTKAAESKEPTHMDIDLAGLIDGVKHRVSYA